MPVSHSSYIPKLSRNAFGKLITIEESQLKFPSDTWQRNVVLREHVGSVTYYKIFTTRHQDLSCIFDFNRGIVWYSLCTGPPLTSVKGGLRRGDSVLRLLCDSLPERYLTFIPCFKNFFAGFCSSYNASRIEKNKLQVIVLVLGAARTLEPLAYTRASSAKFCYPILD